MEEEKVKSKKTVKSLEHDTDVEKQKMSEFSSHMKTNVKFLKANSKRFSNEVKSAASKIREEGCREMAAKVGKYRGDISAQVKEHKTAVAHMKSGIKFFQSEINKQKKEVQAYTQAFWG